MRARGETTREGEDRRLRPDRHSWRRETDPPGKHETRPDFGPYLEARASAVEADRRRDQVFGR
jgi:hypothetical protein